MRLGAKRRLGRREAAIGHWRGQNLFVSYLALNLLCDLWRHRLHAVFFSGVLCRFLHQLIFGLGSSDIIAAVHQITATKHFSHHRVLLMEGGTCQFLPPLSSPDRGGGKRRLVTT